ncbi:RNA polymerase sigma factor [Actinoallomurus sp. NPDC050550]|uniref:RNA polymerase sigma factor n=1 Tax=Actinoallomurus sp. NPDC050550 TaxID=3154937 RepID=UPI0033DBCB2B
MTTEQRARPSVDAEPTDAELIDRSRRNPEDFAAVFDRYADRVHHYLARRAGVTEADDLLSETFATAFDQRDRFVPERSPNGALPWLLGIATNILRSHARSQRRRWQLLARSTADPDEPSPADRVAARIDANALAKPLIDVIAELPDGDRDALLLFAWADLKYEEIASALDIPVGTVRSRIHRVRTRLRGLLGTTTTQDQESA